MDDTGDSGDISDMDDTGNTGVISATNYKSYTHSFMLHYSNETVLLNRVDP